VNLSIVIITYNEEYNLERTLKALSMLREDDFESEIIIIDSGSDDNTEVIARKFTDKFYFNKWNGFAEQRNFGLDKSSAEWVLFLDADEVITEKLASEVKRVCLEDKYSIAYKVQLKSFYLGKLMKYTWQPDIKLRLVHKSCKPIWKGDFVHEKLRFENNEVIIGRDTLTGYLIHYSYKNLHHQIHKMVKYAKLSAEDSFRKEKKFKLSKLLINPISSFIKFYIIKRGFLDGIQGFIASIIISIYTFMKYAFLKELYLKKNYGRNKNKSK